MTQRAFPERPRCPQAFLRRWFLLAFASIFLLSLGMPAAIALQTGSPAPAGNAPQTTPAPLADTNGPLRSALAQAGAALNQVRIDHWKVSREWKGQLGNDASSIQQDLANRLPALFQAAEQAPDNLEPQLKLIHNVDALYDVLVRVTTAANLSGGKTDAAILDNALQNLESSRKAAAAHILQTAVQQDRSITEYQARLRNALAQEPPQEHGKTIVVDNRVTHPTSHHRIRHHKPSPKGAPATTTLTGNAAAAPGSH